ncbi:MAG: CDP-alcohol phosphatidyltransferase family protein [Acidimicrobiia bacterium]
MRIFTVPNALTVIRTICLIPMVMIGIDHPITAAIIAAFLGATDFLDGYIARRFNQESQLGRIIDPISDRLLLIVSFTLFIYTRSIPMWFVLAVGLRELLITAGTLYVLFKEKVRLDVNKIGKTSAFAAMVATPAWVFFNESSPDISYIWLFVAIVSTLIAVPAGYISIFQYFKQLKTQNQT